MNVKFAAAAALAALVWLSMMIGLACAHTGWLRIDDADYGTLGQEGVLYSSGPLKTGGGFAFFFLLLAFFVESAAFFLLLARALDKGSAAHARVALVASAVVVPLLWLAWLAFRGGLAGAGGTTSMLSYAFGFVVFGSLVAVAQAVCAFVASRAHADDDDGGGDGGGYAAPSSGGGEYQLKY